ncbi:MAG: hypothetical protein DHS20C15_10490 [Planctomycetota bacterium]|nr:MAG: hypothetical protein DHS20C15_10490 [Planctomycetota bacterium]
MSESENSENKGAAAPGASSEKAADDATISLHPETASVLATLAGRGIEIPGLQRSAADRTGADNDASSDADAPRYTVIEQVGRGGMGVVLRVRDEDLRRELAMKVLERAGRSTDAQASAPRDLGRFLEEAQVTGQLDHPGVPPIHELGLGRDGRLFFTMKLVRGGTFGKVIDDARAGTDGWSTTRALGVVMKVCEALAYAHHKGVIHRDIKPANIMVGRFGETHVMDWGLAKVLDGGNKSADQPSYESLVSRSIVHTDRKEAIGDVGSSQATLDGDVVGTPAFMAPEQARGELEKMGPHSDIYAVGALLYNLLSGQAPYIEPGVRVSPHTVLRWVIDGPPKPLATLAPDAPLELIAIIEKAMNREPTLRYTSMLDLSADLQAFIEDRVVRAYQTGAWAEARKWMVRNKPLAAAAALLLLVTIGALGAVSWVQSSGRAKLAERNELLGESNAALEDANTQLADTNSALGTANAQLADTNAIIEQNNTELASTNAALDKERAAAESARGAAELAREQAQANAERASENAARAEANERRAITESYAANMTAAVAALESGSGAAARRHLAACPEELRGWDWRHISLRADPSLEVWPPEPSLLWDLDHSPDGRLIATASGPVDSFGAPTKQVRVLDADTGELVFHIPSEETIDQVAFSPDGKLLAWATHQYVSLWDLELGRARLSQHWLGRECLGLEFVDASRLLVLSGSTASNMSRVEIWNFAEQRIGYSVDSNPAISKATPSPDGTQLALGRSDFSVELISLPRGEVVWRRPARNQASEAWVSGTDLPGVSDLAFDANGERLVVTGSDGGVQLLDARDGHQLAQTKLSAGSTAFSPSFHPDGPWVVLGDSSGSVRFLDAETLDEVERLSGHELNVRSVSISPDGDRIVSGDVSGGLRVWDGRPGAASLMVKSRAAVDDVGVTPWLRTIAFSPDGRLVAWTPSARAVQVTDAFTGVTLYRLLEVESAIGGLGGVKFSRDGERLHVWSEVEGLSTFAVSDGRLLENVPELGYMNWAGFDPSGSLVATSRGGEESEIYLGIVEGGVRAATFRGHEDNVSQGQFSADSQRLITCSHDSTIRTWDLRSGESTQVIQGDGPFQGIHLTPDGKRAVTTTLDPTRSGLSLWDLEKGELIRRHPASGIMMRGDLHPDGTLWAGTNITGSVSLWNLERGEMFSMQAGEFGITHTQFDPTGTRLAALDRGGHLYLWDTVHPRERSAARREASAVARHAGEARRLVDKLVDEELLMSRVVAALQADTTLSADLRAAAIRDMRVRGDNAQWIVEQLWARLLPADVPSTQLATSPELAARAEALMPMLTATRERWGQYQDTWEPLLWGLFVLGRYDELAPLVPLAIDRDYTFAPEGPQISLVIQAMLTHASGESGMARLELQQARTRFETAQFTTPSELVDLDVTERLLELANARINGG